MFGLAEGINGRTPQKDYLFFATAKQIDFCHEEDDSVSCAIIANFLHFPHPNVSFARFSSLLSKSSPEVRLKELVAGLVIIYAWLAPICLA